MQTIPIVGMVVTISPSFSLYRMVVLPAASRPTCVKAREARFFTVWTPRLERKARSVRQQRAGDGMNVDPLMHDHASSSRACSTTPYIRARTRLLTTVAGHRAPNFTVRIRKLPKLEGAGQTHHKNSHLLL